jgi:hypothetical protein
VTERPTKYSTMTIAANKAIQAVTQKVLSNQLSDVTNRSPVAGVSRSKKRWHRRSTRCRRSTP